MTIKNDKYLILKNGYNKVINQLIHINCVDPLPEKVNELLLKMIKKAGEIKSDSLADYGICQCDQCGKLCSIDYKFCTICNEKVLIEK